MTRHDTDTLNAMRLRAGALTLTRHSALPRQFCDLMAALLPASPRGDAEHWS
jgi:hypothetical protein